MINLITRISVIGIAAITAALIILLSAFNGIEVMIEKLYSEYDADIIIRAKVGKTFSENRIVLGDLKNLEGVMNVSRALEEVVILKHEKKWSNANLVGVDSTFLLMSKMSSHIIEGGAYLKMDGKDFALIGASLLDKLGGYVPENVGHESIVCYVPKRNAKIRLGKSPFRTEVVKLAGRFNYNREVNAQEFIVPLSLGRDLMGYTNQISAVYIECKDDIRNSVKSNVEKLVGEDFIVKTNYEKNELIYKTSKSEKIIVLVILLFIFILAAFNLVASLTMLFVEKLDNVKTMLSYGASKEFVFKIFFYEGLLIAGKGILIGAIAGYAICFAQMYFHVIVMPNSGGEAFPMNVSLTDGVMILSLVSLLSILFSFLPVKYLIRKNINE
ncbi:MAG: FtsX-like permease family protein [Crocinitomicaceae bacterium]|nr:FtsX-like permease family protein [Crocinitomicaceae bacterium]